MQEIKKINLSLEFDYYSLGDLVKIKYGKNQKKVQDDDNGKYPIYGTGGLMGYSIEYLYDKPSVLIGRKGSIEKVRYIDEPFWTVDTLFYTEVNEEMVIPRFLYYIMSQINLGRYNEGTSIPSLRTETLNRLDLPIPDLDYQNRVLSILSSIDKKIEINEKINKNLLSIADAIYKKEFQNFDTYSEDELIASDFGLIPKNWHYKTLDEISDVGIGKTPPRKETWWFSEQEGVKWVSIKDLGNSGTYIFETSEYLTNEAIEKFNVKLIPINTVILSFKLTVGRIGITTEEMVTNEAIAHFKLSENSVITKEYLYLYLKNFNYEELGSTSSIAKAINSKIVKKIPILIPNNKINEFKDLFENLFNKIKSNQLEINKLTKLRDTLLPKLMSGEIDVSEVNCDLELRYNYMKYLFNQIHTPMSKSVV